MRVEPLVVGPLQTNCYVVACDTENADGSRNGIIIDPGGDAEAIVRSVEEHHLKPVFIVLTHAHADHISASAEVKEAYPEAQYVLGRGDAATLSDDHMNLSAFLGQRMALPKPDRLLDEADTIDLGEIAFRVIHTPGHTPGGICLYAEDTPSGPVLFCGDALFAGSVGRSDFPGGDHSQLIEGIKAKLLTLPVECVVYTGHGPATTIREEKAHNPFLR